MTPLFAYGKCETTKGLPGIARLKGIHFEGDGPAFVLGPTTDQEALINCLLTWQKLHPDSEAGKASVQVLPAGSQPRASSKAGFEWRNITWSGRWSLALGNGKDGFCDWGSLFDAPQPASLPQMPTPYFGREEEDDRLVRLLKAHQFIVLEGLPLMGRTSFIRAFANKHSHDWVEGVEFIDLSPLQKIGELRRASPEAMAREWQSSHKLIVLENATHQAEWLAEALTILGKEQSLCNVVALPDETFLDSEIPRMTLSVLSDDAFHRFWLSLFGNSSQEHRDQMNVRTGKIPGVITALHRQLAGKSPDEIEEAVDVTLARWQPLLRILSQRADDLSLGAARRLRVLSSLSGRFTLDMAIEPFGDEGTSLLELAELLTAGWLTLEQRGYRIPRPLAMAARARLEPTDEDRLKVCQILVQAASRLSHLDQDLVPAGSSDDFRELIWASFEPISWLSGQSALAELALNAAVYFWLPTLTEGYSQEYLAFTEALAQDLLRAEPSQKSAIFWEARGRHLRSAGRLESSLEAHELGMEQASRLGLVREELWNLQFKGTTLSLLGRRDDADAAFEELIPRRRKDGTTKDLAHGLCALGQHLYRNRRIEFLQETLIEAHIAARRSAEPGLLIMIKELQGWSSFNEGDYEKASEFFEEAGLLGQKTLNQRRDLVSLGKALVLWQKGDAHQAIQMVRDTREHSRHGEKLSLLMLELNLSLMEMQSFVIEAGMETARRCFARMLLYQPKLYLGDTLDLAALTAWRTGHASSAAILAGTAFHWQNLFGRGQQEHEAGFRTWLPECRAELGDAAFQARHQAGASLDPMKLLELCRVDYSLVSQMLPELSGGQDRSSPPLSSRQLDVVRLAAQGMSNKEIARVLFLEEGTVKRHLHNASRELGVTGRVSLARKAVDLGLLS